MSVFVRLAVMSKVWVWFRGMPQASLRRRYASVQDAAEYLGVTDRTIRQMISDGRLTGYRNGKKLVRLDLNEIDARMEAFGGDV
jgi:excisionase family DNA binding protein